MDYIRLSKISRPTVDPISIVGRVVQTWGPKNIEMMPRYICSICSTVIPVEARFPYDVTCLPDRCWSHVGGCDRAKSQCDFQLLAPTGDGTTQWTKIHLREYSTDFILILLSSTHEPPKNRDWIMFKTSPKPRLKPPHSTILGWEGETDSYVVIPEP